MCPCQNEAKDDRLAALEAVAEEMAGALETEMLRLEEEAQDIWADLQHGTTLSDRNRQRIQQIDAARAALATYRKLKDS